MKILRNGNPVKSMWRRKIMCGEGNKVIRRKNIPCMRKYRIGIEDLVKYEGILYFICPECGCFTHVEKYGNFPSKLESSIPRISSRNLWEYDSLSDEEKELSDKIFK